MLFQKCNNIYCDRDHDAEPKTCFLCRFLFVLARSTSSFSIKKEQGVEFPECATKPVQVVSEVRGTRMKL